MVAHLHVVADAFVSFHQHGPLHISQFFHRHPLRGDGSSISVKVADAFQFLADMKRSLLNSRFSKFHRVSFRDRSELVSLINGLDSVRCRSQEEFSKR